MDYETLRKYMEFITNKADFVANSAWDKEVKVAYLALLQEMIKVG